MPYPKPIPASLAAVIRRNDYDCALVPLVHRRGWPERSKKPYQLMHADGSHIASFATLEAMEKNFRARAAC